jgi:hypothetical protein
VYAITEAGREEFLRLLRETFSKTVRPRYEIDAAIAFMDALPRQEAHAFFRERVDFLEESLRYLKSHEAEVAARPDMPPAATLIFSHSRLHLDAELAWSREVSAHLARG